MALGSRDVVSRVLARTNEAIESGEKYDGSRKEEWLGLGLGLGLGLVISYGN